MNLCGLRLLLILQLVLIPGCLGKYIGIELDDLHSLQLKGGETLFVQFLVGKTHERAPKEPHSIGFNIKYNSAQQGIEYKEDQDEWKSVDSALTAIAEFNKHQKAYTHGPLLLEFSVKKGGDMHKKCVELAEDKGPKTKTGKQLTTHYLGGFDIHVQPGDIHPCPAAASGDGSGSSSSGGSGSGHGGSPPRVHSPPKHRST